MNISVIYIKQNKSNNAETFEQHFLNKLEKNNSIKMIPISIKKKFNSRALQIEEEGKAIEKKLKHKEELICFDKSGETMSSEKFSKIIYQEGRKINLIIGGVFGLSEDLKKMANKVISFSDMEFSHEVFRVMLLEQIYRANCIFYNHPYHQN